MKSIPTEQGKALLAILKTRFAQNMHRHEGLSWPDVQQRLERSPEKLWSLSEMERTGGEPDVTGYDAQAERYTFTDCSPQSPDGRTNLCYDRQALESRKANKPAGSAMDLAEAMGISMLTEEAYRMLQALEAFDTKTSSWVITPEPIRRLGGALFCDRRYDHVFTYHNGAESYYGVRGFRGALTV